MKIQLLVSSAIAIAAISFVPAGKSLADTVPGSMSGTQVRSAYMENTFVDTSKTMFNVDGSMTIQNGIGSTTKAAATEVVTPGTATEVNIKNTQEVDPITNMNVQTTDVKIAE